MRNLKCNNCGTAMKPEDKFCSNCGTSKTSAVKKKNVSRKKPHSIKEYIIIIAIIAFVVIVYNISGLFSKDEKVDVIPQSNPVTGNSFSSIVQQGHNFMDRGIYDNAITLYTNALSIDSMHPEVMVDLGACYHAIGNNDKAMFQFKRALALDPKQPVAMFNMGVVGITLNDSTMTRHWWNEYLKVAGDSPQAEMVRNQLENY